MIKLEITGKHLDKYNDFYNLHNKKHKPKNNPFWRGTIGGGFTILVTCTSIGDAFEVQCDICKKKLTLQELE